MKKQAKLIPTSHGWVMVDEKHEDGLTQSIIIHEGRRLLGSTDKSFCLMHPSISLLDKAQIEEQINGWDVEKLAKENSQVEFPYEDFEGNEKGINDEHTGQALKGAYVGGYEDGFNKVIELNKDKKFSLEDVQKSFEAGENYATDKLEGRTSKYIVDFKCFISSLQEPKQYDCEYEVEFINVGHYSSAVIMMPVLTNGFLHVKIIK